MIPACADPFEHPFYFLRHGETLWKRERRMQGQTDTALSTLGLEQAVRAAERLEGEPVRRIVASPLSRARITAEHAGAALGLPVDLDPALMEVHLGVHQGELAGPWVSAFWAGDHKPDGGESFAEFRDRVVSAMRRIVAEEPDTLIVAHGGLWYALASLVRFEPALDHMPNALPLHVSPGDGTWRVRLLDQPAESALRTI